RGQIAFARALHELEPVDFGIGRRVRAYDHMTRCVDLAVTLAPFRDLIELERILDGPGIESELLRLVSHGSSDAEERRVVAEGLSLERNTAAAAEAPRSRALAFDSSVAFVIA